MDVSKEKIDEILFIHECKVENLLPILLEIQNISDGRYITEDIAMYIADEVNIPYSRT